MALTGVDFNFYNPNSSKKSKIVDANFDNARLNNNQFLQILLTDLKWQNPLEANNISDFISNSIKLRQMEVLNNFQKTIELLKSVNQTNALLYASNLINKKVVYEGKETYIKNGVSRVSFKLDNNADIVRVNIIDKNGNVVETKTFQNLKANKEYPFEINNPNLTDGYYTVNIEAKAGSQNVKSTIYSTGVVNSVEKDGSNIYANINNKKILIDKINQIGG